jgi:hypothetical protein
VSNTEFEGGGDGYGYGDCTFLVKQAQPSHRHQQLPQIVSYRYRHCHCYNATPRSIVAVPCANRPNERARFRFRLLILRGCVQCTVQYSTGTVAAVYRIITANRRNRESRARVPVASAFKKFTTRRTVPTAPINIINLKALARAPPIELCPTKWGHSTSAVGPGGGFKYPCCRNPCRCYHE